MIQVERKQERESAVVLSIPDGRPFFMHYIWVALQDPHHVYPLHIGSPIDDRGPPETFRTGRVQGRRGQMDGQNALKNGAYELWLLSLFTLETGNVSGRCRKMYKERPDRRNYKQQYR